MRLSQNFFSWVFFFRKEKFLSNWSKQIFKWVTDEPLKNCNNSQSFYFVNSRFWQIKKFGPCFEFWDFLQYFGAFFNQRNWSCFVNCKNRGLKRGEHIFLLALWCRKRDSFILSIKDFYDWWVYDQDKREM